MPFDADAFDRVVALESALHFDTRQDFFAEARRALRPGGVLATADVVLRGTGRQRVYQPLIDYLTDQLEELRARQVGFEKLVMTEKFIRDMRKAIPTNEYVIARGEVPAA